MTEIKGASRSPQESGVQKIINKKASVIAPESGIQQPESLVGSAVTPSVVPMETSYPIRRGARAVQKKAMDKYREWSSGEEPEVWLEREVKEEGKSFGQIAKELQERGFEVSATNLGKRVAPRLGLSKKPSSPPSRIQQEQREEKAQQRRDLVAWADKTGFLTRYNFTPRQIEIVNRVDSGETYEQIAKREGVSPDAIKAVEAKAIKKIEDYFKLEEFRNKSGLR